MAETAQKYKPMHPLMRSLQKRNAKKMIAERPPAADPVADAVTEVKKNLETVLSTKKMTPEQRQAIAAGAARAWYADLPGAAADISGMMLDYGVEGLKSIMPGPELTGYNLEKDLKVDELQEGLRNPFLGYKHLEKVGEKAGYIPPKTGTDAEFNARMMLGLVDPVPLPMTAGVFASNRAKTLPKLSLAKAEKMETARNDPQNIFENTGFFRGPEGEWRFEISDVDMKINQEFLKTKTDLWGKHAVNGPGYELDLAYAKLSDVVDHPELFKAYPELGDVYLKFEPPSDKFRMGLKGYYMDTGEYVPVAPKSGPERTPEELLKDIDKSGLFALERGSNKTPEEYRKVIMVVAPTRQREMKRLDMVIEEATRNKENAFWKIEVTKRKTEMRKQGALVEGNFKQGSEDIIKAEELSIERSQEIIKENLPELQRLQAGGQPDLDFSVKSTITHEIQHAIQEIENLPRGGAPETAFQETREAALAPILEKATKGGKQPELGLMTRLDQEKVLYGEKLQDMAMMDDVHYLQQLQKFIMSDEPTRNARFIENSSFNYGLTVAEESMLGARPKKHRRQEYAEYLRRKAKLYQKKVVDKYVPGAPGVYSQKRDKFNNLLGELVAYTEKKGTATHSKEVGEQFLERTYLTPDPSREGFFKRTADGSQFDPKTVRGEGWEMHTEKGLYNQPNWLALGEKNIKNYVKRLARAGDKHAEGAGLERQLEAKLADLEQMKKDFDFKGRGSDIEFYKRLAGEAEARAVQRRLELADIEAGGYGGYEKEGKMWRFDQDYADTELRRIKEESGKAPPDIYDVPKSELAFTGRTPAAKTQAKSDAQAILNQPKTIEVNSLEELNEIAKERGGGLSPFAAAFTDWKGTSYVPSQKLADELGLDLPLVIAHERNTIEAEKLLNKDPEFFDEIVNAVERGDEQAVKKGTIEYYQQIKDMRGLNTADIEKEIVARELALQEIASSRSPAAKNQAKSDAQAILSQTDEPLHRTLKPETGSVWDDSGYEIPFFSPEGSTEVIPLSPKSLLEKDFDLSQELLIADKTAENITTKKREIIGNIVLHKNTQPDEGPYRITHFYKGADPGSLEPKSHVDFPNLKEALKAFAGLSERHGGLKLIKPKAN